MPQAPNVLWQHDESIRGSAATPSRWVHNKKQYVIVANRQGQITCIDPPDGKIVWKVEGGGANFASVALGGAVAWRPPHVTTTAYHPVMMHAYVAGRLFIRGQNHICSYDVRKDSP